jgi:1-acyl-sn-glycerol-3-phosphate acyltransferase
MVTDKELPFKYPRRQFTRALLRAGIAFAFSILMDLKIEGSENLPKTGPYIVIGNHFHFLDPLALIRVIPAPMEFIGGLTTPNAPRWTEIFRKLWGVLLIRRGASSREGLIGAQNALEQKGIIAIFPEGGSWASVLRPPRPGTALLAIRTKAPIVPVGINGLLNVFPTLSRRKRAEVIIQIGKPFNLDAAGEEMSMRNQMEDAGHQMMRKIQELIPPERHGFYSTDAEVRAAAKGSEIYPWEGIVEE